MNSLNYKYINNEDIIKIFKILTNQSKLTDSLCNFQARSYINKAV